MSERENKTFHSPVVTIDTNSLKKVRMEQLQKVVHVEIIDLEAYQPYIEKTVKGGVTAPDGQRISSSCSIQGDDIASTNEKTEIRNSKITIHSNIEIKENMADFTEKNDKIVQVISVSNQNIKEGSGWSEKGNQKLSESAASPTWKGDKIVNEKDVGIAEKISEKEQKSSEKKKAVTNTDDGTVVQVEESKKGSTDTTVPSFKKPSPSNNVEASAEEETTLETNQQQKKLQSNSRILWITNVPKNTRANELKQLLSSSGGKVVCAKVVVNARFPGSCCFGYVTMSSAEDAINVIAKLNNTEFNGQIIKIDKFGNIKADNLNSVMTTTKSKNKIEENKKRQSGEKKQDQLKKTSSEGNKRDENENGERNNHEEERRKEIENLERRVIWESRTSDRSSHDSRGRTLLSKERTVEIVVVEDEEEEEKEKEEEEKEEKEEKEEDEVVVVEEEEEDLPPHHHRSSISRGGGVRHRANNILTFEKIKEERERQRMRDRERAIREDGRRRHEEAVRLREMREISRRQKNEAERLEREREKLRIERDKIEREKSELVELERERQRIEREKLEMEKMELQRSRLRLEEEKRAAAFVKRQMTTLPYRKREETYENRENSTTDTYFQEKRQRFGPPKSRSSSKDSRYVERDRSPHFPLMSDGREVRHIPPQGIHDKDHHHPESKAPIRWNHSLRSKFSFLSKKPQAVKGGGGGGGGGGREGGGGRVTWRSDHPLSNVDRWNQGLNSPVRSFAQQQLPISSGSLNNLSSPACPPRRPGIVNSYFDKPNYRWSKW